ncbi:hypothetical protein BGW80DRAFT_1259257 [Lactifluus volemus]|nr:hypothetical protein BGW80DRAFT_1259257 [Lactifluus volemus]
MSGSHHALSQHHGDTIDKKEAKERWSRVPQSFGHPTWPWRRFQIGQRRQGQGPRKRQSQDRELPNDEHELSDSPHESRAVAHRSDGDEPVPHTHGWTSILEDFFVHGMTIVGPGTWTRAEKDRHHHHHHHHHHSHPELGHVSSSAGDVRCRCNNTKGPYELLVKERMMVYTSPHSCMVTQNTSSGSMVTTGLIGGRVGNKGAVGISLKIVDTTILFVNAHLAGNVTPS